MPTPEEQKSYRVAATSNDLELTRAIILTLQNKALRSELEYGRRLGAIHENG